MPNDTPAPPQSRGDTIIAKARAHFQANAVRKMYIPEWDETIYWKPLNISEHQKLLRDGAFSIDGGGNEFIYADAIIAKATDEKGEKLFTLEHRIFLLQGVWGVIVERLAQEILSGRLEPLPPRPKGTSPEEHAEGNS